MRVTAGELKGRRLRGGRIGLKSMHGILRPTSSKVREAIFNIIGDKIIDAVFVDLYAGTGMVGIEAMSRRAGKVFFVEADIRRAGAIEDMLGGCGCRDRAVVIREKAGDFMKKAITGGMKFDIVFLDPSYRSDEMEDILSIIEGGEAINDNGIIIAEHPSKKKLPDETGRLRIKKTYKYGDTTLSLYGKVK
jgi:16S rRNA (guanine(966)-N(2))-methyltransferase RsmD